MTENTQYHILVVDDKPDNLRLIMGILEGMNFNIRPAKDGRTALDSAITNPPDLILMDIIMPGMDGYETCRRMKTNDRTRDIPVIFISALDAPFDKVKAFRAGGVDYVSKPFNGEELLAHITTHLCLRNMQKSLVEKDARLQREIIERERAEKMIRESEKRFASVMNSMEAIIYVADMETYEILFVNKYTRNLFGDVENQICWQALQSGQSGPCPFCTNQRLVTDGNPTGIHTWEFQNTVTGKWYHTQNQAIYWTDGRLVRLEIATDISSIKAAEAELLLATDAAREARRAAEAAKQAKSVFLANMSHELRTPLNAILGLAQVMGHSQAVPPEEKESLSIIRRSGEHLLNLINDVLDMSRIEAGRVVLNEKDSDLFRLLDDIEETFRIQTGEKGLQLVFERDADIPRYIRTDESKLHQVLTKLIGNAFRFTREGDISVRVRKTSEVLKASEVSLMFEIEDSGDGIAPHELDHLFDAFWQTKSGQKTQEGTGLGLSISQNFVRMMGGNITVESEIGRRTRFSFGIRARIAEGAETEAEDPKRRVIALSPDQPPCRILIVDDMESSRMILSRMLSLPGFELREAENGRKAVETWEEWSPHLILMDMRMPVMDGYEAAKQIKGSIKGQATAIIAVTAGVFGKTRRVFLSSGCDGYVQKPFRASDIFDAIQKHLGVRYVYEEKHGEQDTDEREEERDILIPGTLTALPATLQESLKDAVAEIDRDRINELLPEICPHNVALARKLAELADDYRYDEILILIHQAEKERGNE